MFFFSGKKPDQQQVASQRDFFIISSYPFFPEEDSEMQSPVWLLPTWIVQKSTQELQILPR